MFFSSKKTEQDVQPGIEPSPSPCAWPPTPEVAESVIGRQDDVRGTEAQVLDVTALARAKGSSSAVNSKSLQIVEVSDPANRKQIVKVKVDVPHPYPSRQIPTRVLEEEDYQEAVSAIIERDFFPDLPRLRTSQAILEAHLDGNDAQAQALEQQLRNMPRATPLGTVDLTATPAATPRPEADGGKRGHTSAADQRLSVWEREDGAESSIAGGIDDTSHALLRLTSGKEVAVDLSNVRLDDFQRVFTSEDNASFEAVLQKDRERRKQKEWWMEDAELTHNTKTKTQALALETTGSAEVEHGIIMTNEFKARNTLQFKPANILQEVIEKPLVTFQNTRFTTKQQEVIETSLSAAVIARKARAEGVELDEAMKKMAREGKFKVKVGNLLDCGHGRAIGGRFEPATPTIAGSSGSGGASGSGTYPLVSTPAMSPGADGMSPLMTYGEIASTPRLLDENAHGPKFSLQDESARSLAAEKLAKGAISRQREQKSNSRKERLRALGITPESLTPGRTPGSKAGSRSATPGSLSGKVTPQSPIGQLLQRAQRMARQGGRLGIGISPAASVKTPATPGSESAKKRLKVDKGFSVSKHSSSSNMDVSDLL
eukprot:TRINITY_DN109795_c0_g1_i1.p1 TRINITY_DN109795_c0_g1~~TRINITY_DN109795_c0_g1_i1.p1  ORF type:complete len:612 (-),score=144.01 TRINITY_DN109795_c0_g1_i1:316-2115(-)